MKYLFLHCTADLYGASRMMLRTINKLVEDSHSVYVVLPYSGPLVDALKNNNVSVIVTNTDPTLRKKCFSSIRRFLRLIIDLFKSFFIYKSLVKKNKIEVIITNTSQTLLGGVVAKICKIKHICHVRESYSDYGILWNIFEKYLVYFSDYILCVSKAMMMQFDKKFHLKKIFVVHDGFPLDEFTKPTIDEIKNFKKKYELNNFIVIGLVGRIILQRKGQDVFVKAISELKNYFHKTKFLIIGSCFNGNEHHQKNLINLINELNISDNVILTGEQDRMDIVYSCIDISIMASAKPEPFGGVTIESMAYGKPVIGTNIGGTPEQIIHNQTGLLIPPNEPLEMANAIKRMINDEELRIRMGNEGKRRVYENFLFDPYFDKIKQFYF